MAAKSISIWHLVGINSNRTNRNIIPFVALPAAAPAWELAYETREIFIEYIESRDPVVLTFQKAFETASKSNSM